MSAAYAGEFKGTEQFVLEGQIGIGGVGVVYRAYDRQRDERVAIKTLRNLDATAIYRLKREFRGLADLLHPNLVSLYELFCIEGQWFFTMELLAGVDFLTYVHYRPPPPGLAPALDPPRAGTPRRMGFEPTEPSTVESSNSHTNADGGTSQSADAEDDSGEPVHDRKNIAFCPRSSFACCAEAAW